MCCSDLETLFINCRSFILMSVYIPPQANVSSALQKLADQITDTEQKHPDSVLIIFGDFNKANLSCELPKYRQHVTCPTRDSNILDHCYTAIKDAYHSVPRAALGLSDHCLVHLIPTYRQKLKSAKPLLRTVKRWTNEAEQDLKACFDLTDWTVFEAAANDLDELTETNILYQFLWRYVHSYQDSSNLQQRQTVVHCKTQTALSGQRRCLQEGGQSLVQTGQIHTGKGDQSGKEELFWKTKDSVLFQWLRISVERSERDHQLQDTIPQHCGESTTGRRAEWVLLQVWKNTIHTSCNPPLPPSCNADQWRWRAPGLQKEQEKEGTRPRQCDTSLSENLRWPSSHRSSTDHWSCAKSLHASNAPPSSLSQRNPQLLDLMTTDLWI